jgi:hypothetical protein
MRARHCTCSRVIERSKNPWSLSTMPCAAREPRPSGSASEPLHMLLAQSALT